MDTDAVREQFREFARSYLNTPDGIAHLRAYEECRTVVKEAYGEIIARTDAGEEVTDLVLLKLLPYYTSARTSEMGAWQHIAPVITGDLQKWFEGVGWATADAWPQIATAILVFVRRCVEYPEQLADACKAFIASGCGKGLQAGFLSPVLNGLRPDKFRLINKQSAMATAKLTDVKASTALKDYPTMNEAGWRLLDELGPIIAEVASMDAADSDLFDMFCYWYSSLRKPNGDHVSGSRTNLTPPDPRPDVSLSGPVPTIAYLAHEASLNADVLTRWIESLNRKGQAIIYGPPGTGKTWLARRLAEYLTGDGGLCELVQFHPAYMYEDFIEGIRPRTRTDGSLEYVEVPGRFLDFCDRARKIRTVSVLIVDEINRANLSRVLGELMYLLEYREQSISLAGGRRFSIPKQVRIIGTMNTADRSIALVDYALRRRFAFLPLKPNYDLLRAKLVGTSFSTESLIQVLQELNEAIGDEHYALGVTYFLEPSIGDHLQDVWQTEIEPYLEEYFFDRPGDVASFLWSAIEHRLGS
jgi:5-methylcytosine-specific restriction enzyme B